MGPPAPTYPEVGASVDGPLPDGYDHIGGRVRIGDAATFTPARDALFGWAVQRAAGVVVSPADAVPAVGTTVRLTLRLGPIPLTAPCRVVWSADGPDRAGFAYGTLQGHPESGEETFRLDRCGDGVWFTIRGFSRPAAWYARLGAPVTRLVQRRVLAVYLQALVPPT